MGIISRPSYELAAGTHTISKRSGILTHCSVVAAAADATISCYDVNAEGDIAAGNKILANKVDVSLVGFECGGPVSNPIKFSDGLVVVVAGAGAVGYIGHSKG